MKFRLNPESTNNNQKQEKETEQLDLESKETTEEKEANLSELLKEKDGLEKKTKEIELTIKTLKNKKEAEKSAKIEQEIINEFGNDYKTKFKEFMSSLDIEEGVLLQSMLQDQIADLGFTYHIAGDFNDDLIEEIYLKIIKENPIKLYKKMSHQFSRGIGSIITDPETGEKAEITQENWRLGPRGQWYAVWEPVMLSLNEKIEKLKSQSS